MHPLDLDAAGGEYGDGVGFLGLVGADLGVDVAGVFIPGVVDERVPTKQSPVLAGTFS
ncbi:hypothetical protein KSW38_15695 [Paenarthrobacter sp. MMS21-TAE1-1]|uniref:Uncharacterized protein n=1 Tax=Paenarthrobacter aromaticivorans TaxID=2849150 RepID=A0ABS6I7N3_9MICC|nr:hypothetical protein [Paenarthrobacter sp. MMS21-TAE1-1]MBU8867732.1 hypothetical protein [Paenarthrobacter sp. MMS21-TAE1-1]